MKTAEVLPAKDTVPVPPDELFNEGPKKKRADELKALAFEPSPRVLTRKMSTITRDSILQKQSDLKLRRGTGQFGSSANLLLGKEFDCNHSGQGYFVNIFYTF